ncbi:protein DPCD [Stomoxys calcitrans]|uniref:Protein DPCD n=1 Tax=Stomoxys calcitrans TaxID=35570 RepID=A0A1I8P1Q3_STOCA|nr:protein DPCD [Stomoxys calcitrans]
MSYEHWLNYLKSAEKNSMISGKSRKVFYKFPDGHQMAEEYSMDTGVVQKRAWRKCKQLMGEPEWEIELGEDPRQLAVGGEKGDIRNDDGSFTVKISNTEAILSKRITKKNIEWRIRNLPYPIDVYDVKADPEKKAIVVRTANKKYYKVIPIPDLDRCRVLPSQENIMVHHQYNTLIITYAKPDILCEMEAKVLLLLKDVETETDMEELLQGLLKK